jgi:hypothetical protein
MFGNGQRKRRLDVRVFPMKRAALTAITVGMVLLTIGVSPTWAQPTTTICVPEKAGTPVVSGTSEGTCTSPKDQAIRLPGPEGLATLNKVLPHLNYVESGVGGKPTIQVSGANLQIVNGEGKTNTTNGAGNLVIGYDQGRDQTCEEIIEECIPDIPGRQTGSHNLIVGSGQSFTSYGGIVAGLVGTITAPYASVTGGFENEASGGRASVSGGRYNRASAPFASVSGGEGGRASGASAWVSGGALNKASGFSASVSGGIQDTASGLFSSVSGGSKNKASGNESSISAGEDNKATAGASSISGGYGGKATGALAWIGGGYGNKAEGDYSSIYGGLELKATELAQAIP